MKANDKAPDVKRVAPYPIAASLQVDGKPVKVAIVYLSVRGVIARTPGLILKVGQAYEVSFEIPVLHHRVRCTGKVSKTYDRAVDQTASAVERLAEFLFADISALDAKQIQRFTNAIGQKTI